MNKSLIIYTLPFFLVIISFAQVKIKNASKNISDVFLNTSIATAISYNFTINTDNNHTDSIISNEVIDKLWSLAFFETNKEFFVYALNFNALQLNHGGRSY